MNADCVLRLFIDLLPIIALFWLIDRVATHFYVRLNNTSIVRYLIAAKLNNCQQLLIRKF